MSKMQTAVSVSGQSQNPRGAGILLHITSLPSRFGVGDLGTSAYQFADYLERGKQKYWQILPLNPTGKEQLYSPYSSTSGMAGNPLLISPEKLVEDGFLRSGDLAEFPAMGNQKADYAYAERTKSRLLEKAYRNFMRSGPGVTAFEEFIEVEKSWLDDFSVFMVLKKLNRGKAWIEWPADVKNRKKIAMQHIRKEYEEPLGRIKWEQYIFSAQWQRLREYCREKNIFLIGDLPFYISHDSADVWANKEIFALDRSGNQVAVAGVPPDYFNKDGQLWGMPVFRWDMLEKRDYDWWVSRIRKNMGMYDIVRLDHFRAFADYWEVRGGEKTAKNGKWRPGPGSSIFKTLKEKLGDLPFIAEDLGDINDAVLQLREKFGFPGMRVLQFAFGDNMAKSDYIPHNFRPNCIAYTGTHDNNTTRGWYRKNIGRMEKQNLNSYTGKSITSRNVHEELIRLAYSSVANVVIIPMQDVSGFDERSRMNMPATLKNNWIWRMKKEEMNESWKMLRMLTELYNRA